MLAGWVVVLASFGYLCLLFAIAFYGDKRADQGRSIIANPYIYSLSLAVYATAWTFYGSVGRAAADGLGFLPIYLGPTLMAVLWWLCLRKIIRISKVNRITSLAEHRIGNHVERPKLQEYRRVSNPRRSGVTFTCTRVLDGGRRDRKHPSSRLRATCSAEVLENDTEDRTQTRRLAVRPRVAISSARRVM